MKTLFDRPFVTAPTAFTNSPIDRDDEIRRDPDALWAAKMHPGARWMLLDELKPLISMDDGASIVWLRRSEVPADALSVFLGLEDGNPRFAVAASADGLAGTVMDTRAAAAQLVNGHAATLARARSLIDWHQRHGFCANCGSTTEMEKAGYARRCQSCGHEHFPRTDPVVIMLPVRGDQVLLGRQPQFPQGFMSALAGFLEPGESIEEAVAREIFEEVGVRIARVAYVASQPWPFPSNLMIGAFAEALSTDISLDVHELEEARWVTRDDVRAAIRGEGSFKMPPPLAIAHTLIATWVDAD